MEKSGKLLNQNHQSFSEKDTIAQARDVFGMIPAWYQENKGLIAKTRLESEEKNLKFSKDLQGQLKNLHELMAKPVFSKNSRPDK